MWSANAVSNRANSLLYVRNSRREMRDPALGSPAAPRFFDEAAANLLASLDLAPTFPVTYRVLAACYAHMGRLDDARVILRQLRAITPAVMEPATRYRNPQLRELFLSGLRLAAGEAG